MIQAPPIPPAAEHRFVADREIRVVLHCIVQTDGHLKDCSVVSEKPAGHEGGAAAIKVATTYFQVKKIPTRDGHPVEGAITIPIVFKPPPSDTAPAQPTIQPPSR